MPQPRPTENDTHARPLGVRPSERLKEITPYGEGHAAPPAKLKLDANEGTAIPNLIWTEQVAKLVNRYPNAASLERRLAEEHGVDPSQVIVTNGGDEAIERACFAVLQAGRELILPVPTFVMIPHYARLTQATITEVPWISGDFPVDEVLARQSRQTAAIAVVSPNNPTGAVITPPDFQRLVQSAPEALVLLDLAYVEFADNDLLEDALKYANVIIIRTFSKAWGMAGLRVGYAMGDPRIIRWLRAVSGPYPVSSISLAFAEQQLGEPRDKIDAYVQQVRSERRRLEEKLTEFGVNVSPSQGNFVFLQNDNAIAIQTAYAQQGIAIRAFAKTENLGAAVRITCPGNETDFAALLVATETVFHSVVGESR